MPIEYCPVSTHSRPKAAGSRKKVKPAKLLQFQHTAARRRLEAIVAWAMKYGLFQHTAARRRLVPYRAFLFVRTVCFNTQPPEGGWSTRPTASRYAPKFQHTAARRRLEPTVITLPPIAPFQHTAARRRLVQPPFRPSKLIHVSTHSRPKAAGSTTPSAATIRHGFNTQPPEGGWICGTSTACVISSFNTQPPEGGWNLPKQH